MTETALQRPPAPNAAANLLQPRLWLHALALILAACIAFAPAMQGDFIWDDPGHVSQNEALRSAGGLWRIWFQLGATQQYYPMTFTSFWLEYQAFGLHPAGYHVTNIVLHALSGVLLWRLLRRLSVPAAYVAAAVFVLHPVQVESVAWISERKNVLSTLLYLAAMSAWVRFALPGNATRRGSALAYALTLLCFLGAMFSKTVACTFPAAAALLLWWQKGRIGARAALALLPLVIVGIGLGLVTVWTEKTLIGAQGTDFGFTVLDRVVLAGRIPWFYAATLAWPSHLTFIYPRWSIDSTAPWQWVFALALLGLAAVLFRQRRALGRGPLTAVLFFVGSLFPALGFFDVYPMRFSFVADHFQYLATLGLIPLLVAAGGRALRALGWMAGRAPVILAILLLAGLSTLTFVRCFAFRDSETLWRDTLARNDAAWIAHSNLGQILTDKGQFAAAIAAGRRALALKPDEPQPHDVIGTAFYRQGAFEQAAGAYAKAVELEPNYWMGRYNLANALLRLNRLDEARQQYEATLALNPSHRGALQNLALVFERRGQGDEAARCLRATLRLDPADAGAALSLARVLATNPRASAADGNEAVRLAEFAAARSGGQQPDTLQVLAAAYARAARFAEAKRVARSAIALATQLGQTALVEAVRAQLQLYEQGRAVSNEEAGR